MAFVLDDATITTLGTCRVFHPIRLCAGSSQIFRHDQSPTYGYVHSSGEIVQQAKFVAGLQAIPDHIWPLMSDEPYRGPPADFHYGSTFFVVEVSSLKDVRFDNWSVKGSRLDAMFGDFDLSRAFWLNSADDQRSIRKTVLDGIDAFHALSDFKKEIISQAYVTRQMESDVRADLEILKEILPHVLIVTHCNAIGLTGSVIEDRQKGTHLVKSAAQSIGLPTFEPETVLERWDQQRAMPIFGFDTAHYRMDFARDVGRAILSVISGKPPRPAVGLEPAGSKGGPRQNDRRAIKIPAKPRRRTKRIPTPASRQDKDRAVTTEVTDARDRWRAIDQTTENGDIGPLEIRKLMARADYADLVMLLDTAPPDLKSGATPPIAGALQRTLHLWCKDNPPIGVAEMVARLGSVRLAAEAEVYRELFMAMAVRRPLLEQIGDLRAALSAVPQLAGMVGDVGRRAMSSGRLETAACLLATMVDYPEQRYAAGRALMRLYKLAFAALKECNADEDYVERSELVLTLNPDQTGTIRSVAVALERLGRLEEAVLRWDRLVANEPGHAPWQVAADRARVRLSRLRPIKNDSSLAA